MERPQKQFLVGTRIILKIVIRDGRNHKLVDPTTFKVYAIDPAGQSTTYTYNVDSFPVKISTGLYEHRETLSSDGIWTFEAETSVDYIGISSYSCLAIPRA